MRAAPTRLISSPTTLSETPDVSVIIVNYNVREFLEQALESVARASAGLRVETFVVDNNSADGSAAMVQERFPHVRLIENEANLGFAVANNQAIREATGRYLLILNPDTLLQEDTLHALVRFMDRHPEAGAAGCRILNPDGSFAPESRRSFPTPSVAFYRLTGLSRLFPNHPTFGRYNLTYLPKDQVCEVDALSGSCMMVRHAALYADRDAWAAASGDALPVPEGGAGLFDEDFFMYGEDLDWCYRIQRAGWTIYYTPETQIIHYKGESTKKGELRYVRLFYGAMLRFVEKHLSGDPKAGALQRAGSRLLALGIRGGIVARALVTFLVQVVVLLRRPALDLALAALAMALGAWLWSLQIGAGFSDAFYALVAPAYALAAGIGVALSGGYRRGHAHRLRPLVLGLTGAFVSIATLSFFVHTIAFSRAALLLGFLLTGLVLTVPRLLGRSHRGSRRVLLVGSAAEAARLQRLLGGPLRPTAALLGYVSDDEAHHADDPTAVEHLGALRHVRDLVRLRGVDDVVFAADSLSNTAILGLMRQLRDLPVQLKILASGRDRIIGKASIEDFSVPLMEAERTVAPLRSTLSRRLLDVPTALFGVVLAPFLRLAARLAPGRPRLRTLAIAAARMRGVLAGRRALVGYDPAGPHPPAAWGLQPGLVSILDTLPERPTSIVEVHRAYWFYARNQSLALDVEILLQALLRRSSL